MSILITGGAGFIGSHLAEACQEHEHIRILDDFSSGKRSNIDAVECDLIEGSILDKSVVADAVRGVDHVFHLAALVSVPLSCERPQECVSRNVTGLLNVLQASVRARVKTFVFASSAAVYGDDPDVPKREDMTPQPRSPYAVTKLDGEYYCELLSRGTSMRAVALRFFNVFGPRQDPAGPYAAAVPIFIRNALKGDPLTVFGDGLQTRDFVPVGDIVSAMLFAAQSPSATGVYNCGRGLGTSIDALARKILSLTGSESQIVHAKERMGDVRHSVSSSGRLKEAGWEPREDFDSVLSDTIAYFKQCPA